MWQLHAACYTDSIAWRRTWNLSERDAASWKDTIWKTHDVSRRFTLRSIRTGQWNRFCTNLMHFHSQPVCVYGTSCWDSISFIYCCLSCVCVCVLVSAPCSSFVISVCMLRCLFLATWMLTQHTTNKRIDLNEWTTESSSSSSWSWHCCSDSLLWKRYITGPNNSQNFVCGSTNPSRRRLGSGGVTATLWLIV